MRKNRQRPNRLLDLFESVQSLTAIFPRESRILETGRKAGKMNYLGLLRRKTRRKDHKHRSGRMDGMNGPRLTKGTSDTGAIRYVTPSTKHRAASNHRPPKGRRDCEILFSGAVLKFTPPLRPVQPRALQNSGRLFPISGIQQRPRCPVRPSNVPKEVRELTTGT